jgi:hypothetical protein
MSLSSIQTLFTENIRNEKIDTEFSNLFHSGAIDFEERLRIYRDNILGGLTRVLNETYPAFVALTGDDYARGVIKRYVSLNLPDKANLDEYGEGFADFLDTLPKEHTLPYLADMARLEWLVKQSGQARDDQPLTGSDLEMMAQKGIFSLTLRQNVFLFSSPFPVASIHQFALQADHEDTIAPALDQGGEYILILRPHLKVKVMTVAPDVFALFEAVNQGQPLEESLTKVLADYPTFDFAAFLQKFTLLETFSR